MTGETTIFFVKPSALYLANDIFEYLEFSLKKSGIYNLKMRKRANINDKFVEEFYSHVKNINPTGFKTMLKTYSGVIELAIISGDNIIKRVKDIGGATRYEENTCLTIRGKFGKILYGEKGYNLPDTLIHASSLGDVEREFKILRKYKIID